MENIFNENIKPTEYDINSDVYLIRKHIHDFIIEDISNYWGNILEIGPMNYEHTPVKRFYLDTRKILIDFGNEYISIDRDKNSYTDIVEDFVDYACKYENDEGNIYDAIICLDVLEHTFNFREFPSAMHRILKPRGKVFVSTPFYFRIHEPKPDYWRFTEEGLRAIFNPYFFIETKSLIIFDDYKRPLHINLIGTKRDDIFSSL